MKAALFTRMAAAGGLSILAAAAFADGPQTHNFTNESLAVAVDAYEQALIQKGAAGKHDEFKALYDKTWADGGKVCITMTHAFPQTGQQGHTPETCTPKQENMAFDAYKEFDIESDIASIYSVAITGDTARVVAFFSAALNSAETGPMEYQQQCEYDISLQGDAFQIRGETCHGIAAHLNPPQPPVFQP